MSLDLTIKQQQVRSANMVSIDIFRRNLAAIILDKTSWQNTIKANSSTGLAIGSGTLHYGGSMDCLVNATACSAGSYSFALLNGEGNLIYDSTSQTAGVNYDGTFCTINCPFTFSLQWAPICPPSGPCIVSQVKVQAALKIKVNLGPMNPSNYSLTPAITRNSQ